MAVTLTAGHGSAICVVYVPKRVLVLLRSLTLCHRSQRLRHVDDSTVCLVHVGMLEHTIFSNS